MNGPRYTGAQAFNAKVGRSFTEPTETLSQSPGTCPLPLQAVQYGRSQLHLLRTPSHASVTGWEQR